MQQCSLFQKHKLSFNKQHWPRGFLISSVSDSTEWMHHGMSWNPDWNPELKYWQWTQKLCFIQVWKICKAHGTVCSVHRTAQYITKTTSGSLICCYSCSDSLPTSRLWVDTSAIMLCFLPIPRPVLESCVDTGSELCYIRRRVHQFHAMGTRCRFGFWPDCPWQDKVYCLLFYILLVF